MVDRFSRLVSATIYRTFNRYSVSPSSEDLEDLHNSLFVALFNDSCKKLQQYQGRSSLATYICVITSRHVVDFLRSRREHPPLNECFPDQDLPAPAGTCPEEVFQSREQQKLLTQAVETMGISDRLLLRLLYERGLSPARAARVMGLTPTAFYKKKARAIEKIRAAVGDLAV